MTPAGRSGSEHSRLHAPSPRWMEPEAPSASAVELLEKELRLPAAVCAVLAARGYVDPEQAKRHLRPKWEHLSDPAQLADGVRAASRIAQAVRDGERIFVHGDYDVDGVCATALLTRWLRIVGGDVVPFVPHRVRDGYDFSASGLAAAIAADARLIVTVDCGTVAHETVASANEAGLEVIVTDHHTVSKTLPDAYAVVNPHRPDCPYPEKGLCGTGLAFRVAELVAVQLGVDVEPLFGLLDLVALATVADLVPLDGENRVLVHSGLKTFRKTQVAGIRALSKVAKVEIDQINAGHLGFQLAPRINAAGRIGDSADALEMLLVENEKEATRMAQQLDETNLERREEGQRMFEEALLDLESWYDPAVHKGVVVAGAGWHPGVIGIVASRVVERVYRPVVVVALGDELARGSARSISGFHLYEALSDCSEHLERFGGHKQAAGMDLLPEALPVFRDAFNRAASARLGDPNPCPVLRPDIEIDLAQIDVQLVRWLGYLGPHGMGNPGPLFVAKHVYVTGARTVGTNHLKAALRAGGGMLEAIGFGLSDRHAPESIGDRAYDVLFRLETNEWRGRVTAQAKLIDLRPSASV